MAGYSLPFETPLFGKYAQVYPRVPEGSSVLELGCHEGYLLYHLQKNRNCRVLGVERDASACEVARKQGIPILQQDVGSDFSFMEGSYQTVLLMDVLEHLAEPESLLRAVRGGILPQTQVLVSVPNVAHWQVRWMLLRGKWEYQETGILDRTHLRFYTKRTWEELFRQCGFEVHSFEPCDVVLPLIGRLRGLGLDYRKGLLKRVCDWATRRFPTFLSVTFLYELRIKDTAA